MVTSASTSPSAQGRPLDRRPEAFGELRSSPVAPEDAEGLREGLEGDGYLLLRGFFPREDVLAARHDLLLRLAARGWLEEGSDPDEALPSPAACHQMLSDDASRSAPLHQLLYGPRLLGLYRTIFGEAVRHFDFTWLRAYPPGNGTGPHMDAVFMNRGSLRLLTAWTPIGDIDTELGGLAVLEGSHRLEDVRRDYGTRDVDAYCANRPGADALAGQQTMLWNGTMSDDPVALREQLGLRWLTTDYRAGDLLTFPLYTAHIGLDNHGGRIRLSSDSRYQPASEPADPRWVGPSPSAHGSRSKLGLIC